MSNEKGERDKRRKQREREKEKTEKETVINTPSPPAATG